jgi:hypothetical protein
MTKRIDETHYEYAWRRLNAAWASPWFPLNFFAIGYWTMRMNAASPFNEKRDDKR